MACWEDVARLAVSLPEAVEEPLHGWRSWRVRKKLFVWERPLRDREIEELGDAAPTGEVLAAHVPDEIAKAALLGDEPGIYFTTSHFDRSRTVLTRLERIGVADLEELVVEAWRSRAPKRLAASQEQGSPTESDP